MDLKLIQKAEQQMMQDGKSASEIDSMKSAYRKQVFNPDGYSQTAGLGSLQSFSNGGPLTSMRPRSRPTNDETEAEQLAASSEAFGDNELLADLMPILQKDPLAMLGYDPKIMRFDQPIGSNRAFYDPRSDTIHYGADYGSSFEVIVHELRHRGTQILRNQALKDPDNFKERYGTAAYNFTAGLKNRTEANINQNSEQITNFGDKGTDEWINELLDNPDNFVYNKPFINEDGETGSEQVNHSKFVQYADKDALRSFRKTGEYPEAGRGPEGRYGSIGVPRDGLGRDRRGFGPTGANTYEYLRMSPYERSKLITKEYNLPDYPDQINPVEITEGIFGMKQAATDLLQNQKEAKLFYAYGGEVYGPPPVRGPAPQGIASFENGGEAAEEVYDAGGRFQYDQDIKEPASVRFLKAMFNRDTYDTSLEKARKIKAGEMPVGYEPPGVRLSRELVGMTPLGSVEAGGDMYDEYNKEDPNYSKLGTMGAVELAGYIPYAGPSIKKMIRGGRGNVSKPLLNDENVEYVSTDFIRSRIPLGNQQRYDVGRIDSAENYRPDEYQYEDFASSEKPSLKESIYNDGIREPIEIFVHKDGSVALGEGHHRLQAATELGFENVPVVVKVGKPSPKIGTYDSPEPFSKINTSGLKTSGEMRFSDVDFDGRGLPVVKTEGTETHKFLQFDNQGIYTGELGPAKSPSKYTPMRKEFINNNVIPEEKYAYGGEVMDGIGSLNETARNMTRGPRGIAGYQQFAVGGEGVRPQSRPPQIEEMPQLRPQSRPPEIEEMAEIRNYLDNLPEVEPEKFFEINSYDRGEGYEQNAIDFKDGMRMFMPDVERMIENSGMASEPAIGSHTAEEVLKFLQENNPTSEEFIKHFTSARLAEGGQVTAPMQKNLLGDPHKLVYINPEEERLLQGIGGYGGPVPGSNGVDAYGFSEAFEKFKSFFSGNTSGNSAPSNPGDRSTAGSASYDRFQNLAQQQNDNDSGQVQAAPPPESNPFLDGAKNALREIFSLNSFNNPAGIASLSRPSPAGYSDANQKFANSMRGVGNLSGSRFSPATYTDTAGQDLTTGPKNTRLMNLPSFMGMGIRGLSRIGGIKKTDPVVNTVGGERVYKMDGGDHYIMNKTTGLPYMVEGPNDLTFSSKHQARMDTMMDSMMDSADGPNESGPNSCGPGYIWNGAMCVPATGTMGSPEESGIKYASDFLPQTQLFADGGQVGMSGYDGPYASGQGGQIGGLYDPKFGPPPPLYKEPYASRDPFIDIYQGPPRGPYDSGFSSENIGRPHMGQPLQQYGQYLEQQYGKPDFPQKRDQFLQEVSQKEQQTFQNDENAIYGIAPSISVYQGPYDTLPMNNASRIPEFARPSIEKDYQKYPSMSRPMANFGGNPFDLSHMMSGNMMLANMMGGNTPLPGMGPYASDVRGYEGSSPFDTSSLLQAEFDPRSFSLPSQMEPPEGGITQLFADGGPVNMENGGVLSSIRPQARTFDGNNERNEARANLMETIYDLESNTDYNKWNLRARNTPDIPLSSMTVKEIMNFQKDDDGPAAGAGQIKYDTFTYLLKNGVISANDVFSSDVQDKAVNRLIDRRGFVSWFEGNTSTEEFGSDMAKEFASLPLLEARVVKGEERQRGQSRYANNEALMGADDWQNVLNSSINMPQTMLAEADVKMPQTMFAEADVNMPQTMPPETFAGQPPVSAVPSGIGSFESSLVPPAEVYAMRGPLQKGPPVAEEEVKEYESLYEKYAPQAFQDALQGIGYYNSPMGPSGSSSDTILASR